MVKIAFFVEGQTERVFLESLLDNLFTHPNFNIHSEELRGGKAKVITHENYDNSSIRYYFLIYDVGGDGSVAGAIYERAPALINIHNYDHVFGIRDLFPNDKTQSELIESTFNSVFNGSEIVNYLTLILAIMEIEAWFLAENTVFSRLDKSLSIEKINTSLNIDIINDDPESYKHPAKLLDDIYKLAGKRYQKRKSDSYNICSRLDYNEFYLNQSLRKRISSFDKFLLMLEEFYN